MDDMTQEDRFAYHMIGLYDTTVQNGWGSDPFLQNRTREIHMANFLGHYVADTNSGPDAYEDEGRTIPVEYKSTTQGNLVATYTGISLKTTWEDQMTYLLNEKICCYPRHYFARYVGARIVEMWVMNCEHVLSGILPRVERSFNDRLSGVLTADSRLSATLSRGYIREHGTEIPIPETP